MKHILYIVILYSQVTYSQGEVGRLFEELPEDSIAELSVRIHTSFLPKIRRSGNKKSFYKVAAIGDINYMQNSNSSYKTGLGAEFSGLINDKWFLRLAAIQGVSNFDSVYMPKSYIYNSGSNYNLYTDIRGRISYTPNHIFNFQAGLDHNFIGQGSRSLFLSDYGKPYPFGLIRANFWRFEYSVLYQFFKEGQQGDWEGKFASSHHISFKPTKWLNIGVFESVVFQPRDTLLERGFDVEYLNPFVFYRPQEYSVGSSDNVLLGLEVSAVVKSDHTIYSQLILDEFYLSELRNRTGWWANKFGAQFGAKGRFSFGQNNFFYRTEYNFVRPYTYSHISEQFNYGNQGQTLSHPYGSNFMEVLGELKWSRNKLSAKFFFNYVMKGEDHSGYSYGGNVYQSYTLRPYEYDHFTGQGNQSNRANLSLSVAYRITKHGNLNVFIENYLRYNTNNANPSYSFVVGIRSLLWNDYRNY